MSTLKKIGLWWKWWLGDLWPRRTVSVAREDPSTDVVTIKIMDVVRAQVTTRNDVFALAAVAAALVSQAQARCGSPMVHDVTITYTPHGRPAQVVPVPDWAVRPLFVRLFAVARELGWQGQCPRPAQDPAYR